MSAGGTLDAELGRRREVKDDEFDVEVTAALLRNTAADAAANSLHHTFLFVERARETGGGGVRQRDGERGWAGRARMKLLPSA